MTEPHDAVSDLSEDHDQNRVARRAALKAAFGGGIAAAAWAAPRIEGLSIAPDYAAAATCAASNPGTEMSKTSNNCGTAGGTECWGNNCCGTFSHTQQIIASRFTVNSQVSGDVNNDAGNISFTVAGIDPPFQRCVVSVTGNCDNSGTFRYGTTANTGLVNGNGATRTFTVNANGTTNTFIDCQGGGGYYQDDPNGNVRLNFNCQCL